MKVNRLSVTMYASLGRAIRQAALRSGVSVWRWLSVSDHPRNERLGAALDSWEAADGPFSGSDLDAAARLLGLTSQGR